MAIKTAAIPMGWESIVYNAGISACLALLLSNFVSLYFQKQKKSFENDLYAGYKGKITEDLGYQIGGTVYYYYPSPYIGPGWWGYSWGPW